MHCILPQHNQPAQSTTNYHPQPTSQNNSKTPKVQGHIKQPSKYQAYQSDNIKWEICTPIFLNNIKSFQKSQDGKDMKTVLESIKEHHTSIFELTETNTNWYNLSAKSSKEAMHKVHDHSKYRTTSKWKLLLIYKPAGTVITATKRWLGQAAISGTDP